MEQRTIIVKGERARFEVESKAGSWGASDDTVLFMTPVNGRCFVEVLAQRVGSCTVFFGPDASVDQRTEFPVTVVATKDDVAAAEKRAKTKEKADEKAAKEEEKAAEKAAEVVTEPTIKPADKPSK